MLTRYARTGRLRALVPLLAALLMLGQVQPAPAGAANLRQGARVASGDDFATRELADPWDMSQPDDIAQELTSSQGNLSSLSFSNGLLTASSSGGDPNIWLRAPVPEVVNFVPQDGQFSPIDAGRYRYLTARAFIPGASNAAQAFWYPAGSDTLGGSQFFLTRPGWNIVTIDLRATGVGSSGSPWAGQIKGLRFDPGVQPGTFQIDFVRLSSALQNVPIRWSGLSGSIDIYVDTAANGNAKALIASGVNAASGSYTWPTSLAAGTYYIFLQRGSSVLETLTLPVNSTPQLNITAPSYISGADYASSVLGNSWDMSEPSDIERQSNLTGASFSNGVFNAANLPNNEDPALFLNVGPPINSARFRYVTFRMRLSGSYNLSDGAVTRLLWWANPQDIGRATTTADILIYEGYQTISFDLNAMKLEPGGRPWGQSSQAGFRLDPHEFTRQQPFSVDYVMLTADDQADSTFAIRYQASDADSGSPSTRFYYYTAGNFAGRRAITCATGGGGPPAGANRVFLPLLAARGAAPVQPSGATCIWQTANVPAGTYYIYGEISDGTDANGVSSRTAVVVSH